MLKKKSGQSPEKNIKLREFSLAHAYGLCIHRTETLVDKLKAVTLVKACGASGEVFWLVFSVGVFLFGVWVRGVFLGFGDWVFWGGGERFFRCLGFGMVWFLFVFLMFGVFWFGGFGLGFYGVSMWF